MFGTVARVCSHTLRSAGSAQPPPCPPPHCPSPSPPSLGGCVPVLAVRIIQDQPLAAAPLLRPACVPSIYCKAFKAVSAELKIADTWFRVRAGGRWLL